MIQSTTPSFIVCFWKAISVITRHKRYLLSQKKPEIPEIVSSYIIFFFFFYGYCICCYDWFFFDLDSFSHWTIYIYIYTYVSTLFTREIIVINLIRFLLVFLASFISFEVSIELYCISFRCWKMDRRKILLRILL